jgi:SAM-dependent methyltransferase
MKFFHTRDTPEILENVTPIFGRRIRTFGNTPQGVMWKNAEGQQLRFEMLAGILDNLPPSTPISIHDFGCGYGAFFDFLSNLPQMPEIFYTGYDISNDMIAAARNRINDERASFIKATEIKTPGDFTIVSGTYNLKVDVPDEPWNAYIRQSLKQIWSMTNQGLAFNMLNNNHPEQGDSLYYADADEFMEFCAQLSPNVSLIDDYPLHEWTIFIHR